MLIKAIKFLLIAIVITGLMILGLNFWIVSSTKDAIYYQAEDVPTRKVGLILGTAKSDGKGGVNKYFKERVEAAAELYYLGKVQHLIVSGDNRTIYYNEPRDMYQALAELGVDKADITLDFAGLRTLDSVVRSKLVFDQDEIIIITQDFHCYRSLFIANYHAIDAVAYAADNKDPLPSGLAVREIMARVKSVMDLYILDRSPKFLGKKEKIPVNQ